MAIIRAASLSRARDVQVSHEMLQLMLSVLLCFSAASTASLGRRALCFAAAVQLLPLLGLCVRSLPVAVPVGGPCSVSPLPHLLAAGPTFFAVFCSWSRDGFGTQRRQHVAQLPGGNARCSLGLSASSRSQIIVPGETRVIVVYSCSCSLLLPYIPSCHFLGALNMTRARLNRHYKLAKGRRPSSCQLCPRQSRNSP